MTRIIAALMLFFITVTSGCDAWDSWQRMRQVSTFSMIQHVLGKIQNRRGSLEGISESDLRSAIASVSEGYDAWGNQILFKVSCSGSFVIVSPGRDGKLDLPTLDDYFSAQPENVHGKYARDIFFRDGKPIWKAGK